MTGGREPGDEVRVALVGFGLAGAVFHAPLLEATPGLRLAAIITADPARSAAARERHPGATILPHTDRLWDQADDLQIEAVILATPHRTHLPLGLEALQAGLHLVVDKPLAPSAAEGQRLLDEAHRRGRVATVFQNRRWDADFLTLRRLLDDGALGTVHRFESRFERWRTAPKPGWRQEPGPDHAGGVLFDLGAHLVDQALLLFGPVRHVHAELDRRRPGSRVDDDAFLALTHHEGTRSHLWMNVIAAHPGPRFRVLGARATWVKPGLDVQEAQLRAGLAPGDPTFAIEPPDQWGRLHTGEGDQATPSLPGDYASFYRRFVTALRAGGPPPVPPEDAVAGLQVMEAARHAAGWHG
jgi:scyllo-inositol 2-dehydrogenase (NADP+)